VAALSLTPLRGDAVKIGLSVWQADLPPLNGCVGGQSQVGGALGHMDMEGERQHRDADSRRRSSPSASESRA
jgi:hypothetical protein